MMRILLFIFTNLAVMLVFGLVLSLTGIQSNSLYGLIIFSGIAGFSGAIISLLLSKWLALRAVEGKVIATPQNELETWLFATITKQAEKAGIKTPQIAIYDAPDINAFATGARRNASLVAVSSGLLEHMKRNEAEAVLAHEISHIANGDMITMTLLQGVLNTVVIFASRIIAGFISRAFSKSDDNESGATNSFVYMGCAFVLDLIFGMLASLIVFAFSRHREFHADAGSAKLVGAHNMIAALKSLKNSYEPKEPNNIMALCINGKKSGFSKLFMTHPPLDDRIKALRAGQYIR